jgi:hypothetical protein
MPFENSDALCVHCSTARTASIEASRTCTSAAWSAPSAVILEHATKPGILQLPKVRHLPANHFSAKAAGFGEQRGVLRLLRPLHCFGVQRRMPDCWVEACSRRQRQGTGRVC